MTKSPIILSVACLALFMTACATMPKGASPVSAFDKARYLGKWYEIARYDFAFEKGLDHTTANYALRGDGYIEVVNRGRDIKSGQDKEARGRARFRGPDNVGELEVSFFGPFFAAYNVIALEGDYSCALVAGSSTKYLWFLSREPTMPEPVKERFLAIAAGLGYDTGKLVWVDQGK
jgi:apolipoprotein D and lipocalin family protein